MGGDVGDVAVEQDQPVLVLEREDGGSASVEVLSIRTTCLDKGQLPGRQRQRPGKRIGRSGWVDIRIENLNILRKIFEPI